MKPKQKGRARNDLDSMHVHRPKRACSHVAQEVRELGDGTITTLVEELTRPLMPWARANALGL